MTETRWHDGSTLDGAGRPAHDDSVDFAVGSVATRAPRRPVVGLAIAVVTAVVTMGALGPRGDRSDNAPIVPDVVDGAAVAFRAPDAVAPPSPAASHLPWWQLPQMALWVDPATGRAMQATADRQARHRMADHRARDH